MIFRKNCRYFEANFFQYNIRKNKKMYFQSTVKGFNLRGKNSLTFFTDSKSNSLYIFIFISLYFLCFNEFHQMI